MDVGIREKLVTRTAPAGNIAPTMAAAESMVGTTCDDESACGFNTSQSFCRTLRFLIPHFT